MVLSVQSGGSEDIHTGVHSSPLSVLRAPLSSPTGSLHLLNYELPAAPSLRPLAGQFSKSYHKTAHVSGPGPDGLSLLQSLCFSHPKVAMVE